jgi:hypothetical protein
MRFLLLPALLLLLASIPSVLPACGGTNDQAACNADMSQADTMLDAEAAAAGCTVDSDCLVINRLPSCVVSCGGFFVSKAHQAAFASAVDDADNGPCADYSSGGCESPFIDCPAIAGVDAPQCIAGSCVTGYEADWTSFTVQMEPVGTTSVSVGVCDAGCTEWTVTPDGQITGTKTITTALAPADFALIDSTLRDPSFRQALISGQATSVAGISDEQDLLSCATTDGGTPPSSGMFVLAGIDRPVSGDVQGDVTDCATAPGPFAAMYAVLQKY